ncbi:uncharacterized protein LOC143021908 isoform X2 [Oratosquilla oratoria]|uniref:uncharacterized protein LOC143021908 isoform X2 n=1 Tax=Oratosquilla oratoria TaxID=337810 RepID=UPI003F763230
MATTQTTRQSKTSIAQAKTNTWTSVFPPVQKTEQQSLLFVKKLIAVSISSITYLRAMFPESAYGDRVAEGINLKILLDESHSPEANTLIGWIKGCFDALEKKYLQQMTLGLYLDPDAPDVAVETYTFRFSYSRMGEVELDMMEANSKKDSSGSPQLFEVRRPTIKLLRTIIILSQSLQLLPETVYLSMKLHYFDDVTPPDYEPPGFSPCSIENYEFQEEAVTIKVGSVSTAFHNIKLRVRTGASQFDLTSNNQLKQKKEDLNDAQDTHDINSSVMVSPPSTSRMLDTQGPLTLDKESWNSQEERLETLSSHMKRHRRSVHSLFPSAQELPDKKLSLNGAAFENQVPCLSPTLSQTMSDVITNMKEVLVVPSSPDNHSTPSMLSAPAVPNASPACSVLSRRSTQGSTKSEPNFEYPVQCPCGVNIDDDLMILCDVCGYWQHAACFAVVDEEVAPEKHVCQECAPTPHICTDPRLCSSDFNLVQATCLYRRALVSLSKMRGRISEETMARRLKIDCNVAKKILDRFIVDKIVKPGRTPGSQVIDKDVLFSDAFPRYLNKQWDTGTQKTKKQIGKIIDCLESPHPSLSQDVQVVSSQEQQMLLQPSNDCSSLAIRGDSQTLTQDLMTEYSEENGLKGNKLSKLKLAANRKRKYDDQRDSKMGTFEIADSQEPKVKAKKISSVSGIEV